jgi:hypothetical protein
VIRRTGALVAGLLLLAGCTALGDPGWSRQSSGGCRQQYGTRGSTSATRPDLVFFCVESP